MPEPKEQPVHTPEQNDSTEDFAIDEYSLLVWIRVENMRGLMYYAADGSEPVGALVDAGLVVEVPATPTSLRGYVAVPAATREPAVNASGGEA